MTKKEDNCNKSQLPQFPHTFIHTTQTLAYFLIFWNQ